MGCLCRWAWIAVGAGAVAACAPILTAAERADRRAMQGPAGIDVLHQAVEIAPFTPGGALKGAQTFTFRVTTGGDRLRFEGGPIQVLSMQIDGRPVTDWRMTQGTLEITLAEPAEQGSEHSLTLAYEAAAGRGVHLSDGLAYTAYFSCDWMLCDQQDFDDRFTFDLTIRAPRGMTSLGPGDRIETVAAGPDDELHRWRTREPFPAYVHAFAVGSLTRFEPSPGCDVALPVVSTAPREHVVAIFEPTCAMLGYFERRSGVAYPADTYSQLYDPDRWEAQEAVSHSVLGGGAVEATITDPREDWAVAHELAHQWWGNRVTARTLAEFWLNEGVVTFMVAGWKEHRWGPEAYAREIDLARGRWTRCRAEWREVPIAFAGPYPSLATRRCFQYSKAAVFLHELRATMGDEPFWSGLRRFTTTHLGRSVTSRDFHAAMQEETRTDLGPLFSEWVYDDPDRP